MANLSNINNKFLVTTGGNVLIGGTAVVGTAKLQVTGEARVYTGSNLGYWGVDAGNSYVYLGTNSSAYGLSLQTGGIDRVNINDAGNVFISTPITNAFYGLSLTYNNTNTADFTVNQATGQIKIGGVATGYFPTFYSAGAERMRIDSSGNLLLGAGLGNPYLALISAGGNGGNERARMFGYADGGTYGGGLKLQTRDNSNIFNDALIIDRSGNAVIKGKIESVKELVNINSANGIRSAGLESDSTGNIWLGTGTTAATINFVTGNSTNSNPSVNGVKRLTTNREGTDVYASYSGSTFPFRVGYLSGSTYIPTFSVKDNGRVFISVSSGTTIQDTTLQLQANGAAQNAGLMFINKGNTASFNDIAGIASFIESGSAKGNLQFWTRNSDGDNSNVATRMTINASGNVGIGNTPASDAKLEVWNGNLRVRGDQNAVIQLSNVAGNTKSQLGNAGNEGDLSLYTSGNAKTVYLSSYYNSYINPAGGNVGIGTTSPWTKLAVSGTTASTNPITRFTTSTTSWTTILTFTTGTAYSVLLATSENNFSQMWRVSGSVNQQTCYYTLLGDSGHTHSKDVEFRMSSSALQFKNVNYTTGRYLYAFDVVQSNGTFTY